ncbi:MAG: methyltransferase domain-containing protein [Trichormus sp. ATA11-4-KO1]|jgi:ubiquinone/menaquinone biosynthesis C-methylase UbiE|nr:methyltransferase domain-containing protein [Trichormus sp. ATA11-4-KO1]
MIDNPKLELPYFDQLLEGFRQGNTEMIQGFGLHVHWGYWDDPSKADGSIHDFALAAENLSRRMYDAGKVTNGQKILDCGCGFGGTIASLNHHFDKMQLIGLNIDPRQLTRARAQVQHRSHNSIKFVQGDACKLPFADNSFDIVLAVECIFHFPSRQKFFQEVWRVLKPGGRLIFSDFIPLRVMLPFIKVSGNLIKKVVGNTYGHIDNSFILPTYRKLAQSTGFTSILEEDITSNTLPTYSLFKRILRESGNQNSSKSTNIIEWVSRMGLVRYYILSYRKND